MKEKSIVFENVHVEFWGHIPLEAGEVSIVPKKPVMFMNKDTPRKTQTGQKAGTKLQQ